LNLDLRVRVSALNNPYAKKPYAGPKLRVRVMVRPRVTVSAPGPRVRPRVTVHPVVAAAAVQGHVTAVDQSGIK